MTYLIVLAMFALSAINAGIYAATGSAISLGMAVYIFGISMAIAITVCARK